MPPKSMVTSKTHTVHQRLKRADKICARQAWDANDDSMIVKGRSLIEDCKDLW